jgi:glucan 1,3-beta-glucosidase
MDSLPADKVLYFDHGYYIVTSTVNVPKNIKITGEIWPLIMAKGSFFNDQSKPQPVFSVGKAGESGAVEISELMFETMGPAAGAIMLQWNLNGAQGANGLWDTHIRVGGSAGTQLQSDKCSKAPEASHANVNTACIGAYMLFHSSQQASVYMENTWFWVSDHELDLADHRQIDIYNGRGVLIESQNPVWMYGTASEHSVLYQYQLTKAKNVFMGFIQSESAYYQSNPQAPAPFTVRAATDPTFSGNNAQLNKGWGLRIVDSSDIAVYGAGLYSFFENYGQTCVNAQNCQTNMISYEGANNNVVLYGISTKAAVNMVSVNGKGVALDQDNRSNFCATLALFSP